MGPGLDGSRQLDSAQPPAITTRDIPLDSPCLCTWEPALTSYVPLPPPYLLMRRIGSRRATMHAGTIYGTARSRFLSAVFPGAPRTWDSCTISSHGFLGFGRFPGATCTLEPASTRYVPLSFPYLLTTQIGSQRATMHAGTIYGAAQSRVQSAVFP